MISFKLRTVANFPVFLLLACLFIQPSAAVAGPAPVFYHPEIRPSVMQVNSKPFFPGDAADHGSHIGHIADPGEIERLITGHSFRVTGYNSPLTEEWRFQTETVDIRDVVSDYTRKLGYHLAIEEVNGGPTFVFIVLTPDSNVDSWDRYSVFFAWDGKNPETRKFILVDQDFEHYYTFDLVN